MKTAVETIFVGREGDYNPALLADVQSLFGVRGRVTQRWGEKASGREPSRLVDNVLLSTASKLRRAEWLAAGPVHHLRQGAPPSRTA